MNMAYKYTWTFTGRTSKKYDTIVDRDTDAVLELTDDNFDKEKVVQAVKTILLSDLTTELRQKLAAKGFGITIDHVDPTGTDVMTSWESPVKVLFPGGPHIIVWRTTFHHYLRITAKVSFSSDSLIAESPFPFLLLAECIAIIVAAAGVTAAIILVAEGAREWITSFGVEESSVVTEKYDPTTGKLIETITETQKSGAGTNIVFWIGMAVVAIAIIAVVYVVMKFKGKTKLSWDPRKWFRGEEETY
jgi:hypothetical protein